MVVYARAYSRAGLVDYTVGISKSNCYLSHGEALFLALSVYNFVAYLQSGPKTSAPTELSISSIKMSHVPREASFLSLILSVKQAL